MDRRFEVRREELMKECKVSPHLFEGMLTRLRDFVRPFAECLVTARRQDLTQKYVAGLVSGLERKSIEPIAYYHNEDRLPLQRFIGTVRWDHRPLLTLLTQQVAAELGEAEGVIVFDPSAHSKKGKESVGVKRQWNGRKGKVDNCQVGVYMGYVSRREQALVDERLYLPKEWAKDKRRRKKCGVPAEVRFATRLELALEMLEEKGPLLPHAWVAGDEEMGRSTQFRRDLRALKEQYLLVVPCNTLVRDLEAEAPRCEGRAQPPPGPFVRADRWAAAQAPSAWTRVEVRDGEKGPLVMHVVTRRVLAITERNAPESEEVLVVVLRTDEEGKEVYDYLLSSASSVTPRAEFARVANAEHRIEECLKRAKSECGMSHYETRTWWGWHHHQALSLLATWFLVQETRRGKKIHPGPHGSTSPQRDGQVALRSDRSARRPAHRSRYGTRIRTYGRRAVLPSQETQSLGTITRSSTTMK